MNIFSLSIIFFFLTSSQNRTWLLLTALTEINHFPRNDTQKHFKSVFKFSTLKEIKLLPVTNYRKALVAQNLSGFLTAVT